MGILSKIDSTRYLILVMISDVLHSCSYVFAVGSQTNEVMMRKSHPLTVMFDLYPRLELATSR